MSVYMINIVYIFPLAELFLESCSGKRTGDAVLLPLVYEALLFGVVSERAENVSGRPQTIMGARVVKVGINVMDPTVYSTVKIPRWYASRGATPIVSRNREIFPSFGDGRGRARVVGTVLWKRVYCA